MNKLRIPGGRTLTVTPVFETYWRFAARRQEIFMKRARGESPPWTADEVLASHRFTNVFRASDRVSQFLIKEVSYRGNQSLEEVFFRTILFKIFNKIKTWETLRSTLGEVSWRSFDFEAADQVLTAARARGDSIYSAAYIMPSPGLGGEWKHTNHLMLLKQMMRDGLPADIGRSKTLERVYKLLVDYRSLGPFLAFQFAIDLNYSSQIDFSEMEFVVAGPGARDGIRKCFSDVAGLTDEEIIRVMADIAPDQFDRFGLHFNGLWGRPLQLIDCQNVFCEVDKYSRVVHPSIHGITGRTRIKQKYNPQSLSVPQWYPPKWSLTPLKALAA